MLRFNLSLRLLTTFGRLLLLGRGLITIGALSVIRALAIWSLLAVRCLLLPIRPRLFTVLIHVDDTVVMFGELQICFCLHTVTAGLAISRQLQILIQYLLSASADLHLGSVALICLVTRTAATTAAVAAAITTIATAVVAAASGTSLIWSLLHSFIFLVVRKSANFPSQKIIRARADVLFHEFVRRHVRQPLERGG